MRIVSLASFSLLALLGCSAASDAVAGGGGDAAAAQARAARPFAITPVTKFSEPWAMTFLPDGSALVTEKKGRLVHWASGWRTCR
jgi:glucose/arabinose dehydrogenase